MIKISKRTVEALAPTDAPYFQWDEDLKGFGVRVLPSKQRTYVVQYRSGGRTRRVKIGRHGAVTAEEARAKAKELLGAVAKGNNPAEEISVHRQAPTVATVCDRFLRDHVARRCKPSTQAEYRRSIELFIKPALGAFKIVDVLRKDVSQLHSNMHNKPYQANRTLGVLSKLFNLCEVWGLRPDGSNPCRHVPKYKEHRRETFLNAQQLKTLGNVLNKAHAEGESPYAVAAFQLLILTGCRRGEIQTLKWSYVKDGYLQLPDTKTGPRRIPLSAEAQAILDNLPRLEENEYVICGDVPGQFMTDLEKPWRKIRKRAGLNHVRIHDLRHTYASNALALGLDLPTVAQLLGHSQIATTMRYIHFADQSVRKAAAHVGSAMGEYLKTEMPVPVSASGNVVAFPGRATRLGACD